MAILGGGVAGLSLAIQTLRQMPETKIVIVEKRPYPFDTDNYKVGEALVEMGSYYLRETLGLHEHLEGEHIVKTGLRFYLPRDGAETIEELPEIGTDTSLPLITYLLDRTPFENHLVEVAKDLGAVFVSGATVHSHERVEDVYEVKWREVDGEEESIARARWLIDATGRRALLRKKHKLTESSNHDVGAGWFRINKRIDPQTWSTQDSWVQRVPPGKRRHATNHLIGPGYWVWVIALRNGATSIGIVADPKFVDFSEYNQLDRALAWIKANVPILAAQIDDAKDEISGFVALKNVSYKTKQLFSPERWCLTGEAATFTDPLYSTGLDLIAISNTMILNIFACDKMGGDIRPLVGFMNEMYLSLYEVLMGFYRGQYGILGNAAVFSAKTAWDFTIYMMIPFGLFCTGKLYDPGFMQRFGPTLGRAAMLTDRVQQFLREWAEKDSPNSGRFAPDYSKLETVLRLQRLYLNDVPEDEILGLFEDSVTILEEMAIELFNRVTTHLGIRPASPARNPYAISLDPSRWEADGLFGGEDKSIRDVVKNDIAEFWFQAS